MPVLGNKKPRDFNALAGEKSQGHSEKQPVEVDVLHRQRIAHSGELKARGMTQSGYLYTLKQPDSIKAAYKLQHCANWMLFRNYYTVEQIKLARIETCQQHLLCPFCAAGRASRSVQAYTARFSVVRALQPKLKPIFLTLTVKNGEDLSERFRHLQRSFKTLLDRRRDSLKKGRGFCEFSKLEGLVYSFEFTKGKTGWHPHVHLVALAHDWIDQEQLSREWQSITGDSFIVDVRRVKRDKDTGYGKAFAEVFKYALKFSGLSHADAWHAHQTLKGKRLTGSVGCFRGVKLPDIPEDDLTDFDALPYLEMLYQYKPQAQGYSLESTRSVQPQAGSGEGGEECSDDVQEEGVPQPHATMREAAQHELPPPAGVPSPVGSSPIDAMSSEADRTEARHALTARRLQLDTPRTREAAIAYGVRLGLSEAVAPTSAPPAR